MSTTPWVPMDRIAETVDPGILKYIAYGAVALFLAMAAVSAVAILHRTIRNRINNNPPGEKARSNPSENPLLSKRMIAPLSLIAFNIILGWQNLHRFASEDMGVGTVLGHLLIFIFSGMVLWAGYERFQYSLQNKSVPRLTVLLWTSISIESILHFASSFQNNEVHGIGPIALALLPWGGGVVFELSLGLNKSDKRNADDAQGQREIPSSLKRSPLFYLQVLNTKAENPNWTAGEIIRHVRATRAADAVAAYERVLSLPAWVQPLAGKGRADARARKRLIELNPTGRPSADPRQVLADALMVRHSTIDVSTARGDRDAIIATLGGTPTSQTEDDDDAPAVDAGEDRPALEASHSGGDTAESDLASEVDKFLSQTFGTEDATPTHPGDSDASQSDAPGDATPSHPGRDTNAGASNRKKHSGATRRGASKKGASRDSGTRVDRVAAIADLMRQRRDAGGGAVTAADAAEHLGKLEGRTVARGSAYRYIKKAQEKVDADAT